MLSRILLPILASAALSGCCSTPVDTPIGIPPGPDIEPINRELWLTIPPHVRGILLHNTKEWEGWYEAAADRIDSHDEALTD